MADLPLGTPDGSGRNRLKEIAFDPRITAGNILTIIAGIFAMLVFFTTGGVVYENVVSRLDKIQSEYDDLRCTLVAAGIAPTTSPCTLPPIERGR